MRLTWTAPETYRGKKLIASGDTENIYIKQITVDGKPQIPLTGNLISALCFSPDVLENEMLFDKCPRGKEISIEVWNSGDDAKVVSFTLFGNVHIRPKHPGLLAVQS